MVRFLTAPLSSFAVSPTLSAAISSDMPVSSWYPLALGFASGVLACSLILLLSLRRRWSRLEMVTLSLWTLGAWAVLGVASFAPASIAAASALFARGSLLALAALIHGNLQNRSLKSRFGTLFSGLGGALLAVEALNLLFPLALVSRLLELLLAAGIGVIALRQLLMESGSREKAQFAAFLLVAGCLVWSPARLTAAECILYFSALFIPILLFPLELCLQSEEQLKSRWNKLQRDWQQMEAKSERQLQLLRMLQSDCGSLESQLGQEAKERRQRELTSSLRIRALEQMTQDIARAMVAHLRDMEKSCRAISVELRTREPRLPRIKSYADRASRLAGKVHEVMGFLEQTEEGNEAKLVNARTLLSDCLRLCQTKVKKMGAEIEFDIIHDDLWIEGRLTLLVQAYLGLLYSALDSIEAAGDDVRRITLRLARVEDGDRNWVELRVSDSGQGIATSVREGLFEKKKRDGLEVKNLGLSMAFGVFEGYGGSLTLDSEAVASTYVARLPLFKRSEEPSLRLVS